MRFFKRIRLVKECKRFVLGYKCLTANGIERIDRLYRALESYKNSLKDLDSVWFVNDVENGLTQFAKGTEDGFVEFEKQGTLDRLIYIINTKGRLK